MFIPMRRLFGIGLSVLALWGTPGQKVQAQIAPGVLNPYVNPFAAGAMFNGAALGPVLQGRAMLAGAGLSHPLAALAGFGYGTHLGAMAGMNYGAWASPYSQMGYGSLLNGGGYGGMAGYGAYGGLSGYGLIGTAASGAALGYGYGYGMGLYSTQWMMNPYQGYLQGAASITKANAQYYQTIAQARLTRQEGIRSSLETRRAFIEEAEWERAHMPDPEKIRQQALERELSRARVSPPPTDIWSARSLNALLRHLITQQSEGARGPKIPLSEDIVKHINTTAGNTRGNIGLIKDNGHLDWPESLMRGEFKETRERINTLMKEAYRSAEGGSPPSDATLSDLQDNYRRMKRILEANVAKFSPNLYIEGNRYLGEVKEAIAALKDPNIVNYVNGNLKAKGRSVAELIQFMREKGLRFAPASDKDRAAYVALQHALAAFDAGMSRTVNTNGNADSADGK